MTLAGRSRPPTFALLAALAILLSCAHSVRFITVPAGAQLSIDGKPLGPAPALYQERSGGPGRTHAIRAEIAGFAPISLREPVRICATPANLLLDAFLVGIFWGFCLQDEYVIDFTESMPLPAPSPAPSPSPVRVP